MQRGVAPCQVADNQNGRRVRLRRTQLAIIIAAEVSGESGERRKRDCTEAWLRRCGNEAEKKAIKRSRQEALTPVFYASGGDI